MIVLQRTWKLFLHPGDFLDAVPVVGALEVRAATPAEILLHCTMYVPLEFV